MKKTTKNVNWDRDVKIVNDELIIATKKTDVIFKGEDSESLAIKQAKALANFFSVTGRHKVYKIKNNHFEITFDECVSRDGVEDDYIYSACSHSNSGTYSWKEARTFSVYD